MYKPASSAVGLYQMTDPTYAEAARYCIRQHTGRFDLLAALRDFVAMDATHCRQEPKVIVLGDIVDRGPNNKDAIELVAATLKRWPSALNCRR